MANKKKATTAIVAGVTAVALALGGTFAWTSISQQAKNESAGIVNVGGRLHDDFTLVTADMAQTYSVTGSSVNYDKDVYVENFTDPLNGGQPIYARIRLDEYMEVGKEAGGVDLDGNGTVDAVPVIDGTKIDDVSTWTTHVPFSACETCATEGTCKIHDHWTWAMGNTEAKAYMPTFNKDKDSLKADINGTYAGTNDSDKIYYDDYVTYATSAGIVVDSIKNTATNADGTAITLKTTDALTEVSGAVTTVTDYAWYDNDTNTDQEPHEDTYVDANLLKVVETHTAKNTGTAEVVLMSEWSGETGNFWVYDTDGWAYWANPIMPGEATGLLLNGFEMIKNPGERCYYAINVVAQFATVNDWELFGVDENDEDYPSEDALKLLVKASQNVTVVTVTNNGSTTVDPGDTVNFSATASVGGTKNEAATFTWAVYDADLKPVTTSTISDAGVLTVGANEMNANLIIAATDTDSGAVGLSSIAVNVPVTAEEYEIVLSLNGEEYVSEGYNLVQGTSYDVSLMRNGAPVENVTYSVSGVETSPEYEYDIFPAMKEYLENNNLSFNDYISVNDNQLVISEELFGQSEEFLIIEIVATDADANTLAARRFIINEKGVAPTLFLIDSKGNYYAPEMMFEPWLLVDEYSWFIGICDLGYGYPLNLPGAEYLTPTDLGISEELSELHAAVVSSDPDTGEDVYIPNSDYIAVSSDLKTISITKEYKEEGLVLLASNVDGTFDYSASVMIDFWNPIQITVTKDGETVESRGDDLIESDYVGVGYDIVNYANETYVLTFNRAVEWENVYSEDFATAELSENNTKITMTFSGKALTGVSSEYGDNARSTRLILRDAETNDLILIDFVDVNMNSSTD